MRTPDFFGFPAIIVLSSVVQACSPEAFHEASTSAVLTAPEQDAVIALVNDPAVDFVTLDEDVGLDRRAAENIVEARPFASIAALDAVPFVGSAALRALLDYARAHGYLTAAGGLTEGERVAVILAVANDPAVSEQVLDVDVGLDARAARNIAAARPFATFEALDGVPYVGEAALDALYTYGLANGYGGAATADVIFSPQSYQESHNVRVAEVIDDAQHSLDVAMYSFSDEGIYRALERAVQRGVSVRFIFDTASQDRRLVAAELDGTRSARLEGMGVDVRWVNKIMHHKLVIVDGPRGDLDRADTGTLITGSGNWSYGAATRYDENTLFLTGERELLLLFQREFDHLWDHSRDFSYDRTLAAGSNPTPVTGVDDEAGTHAFFTSANFTVSGDTFRVNGNSNEVSDQLVAAILGATESIHVASGHLRSRPVAEALMAAKEADPSLDIRVYLDGQEYVSDWYHEQQIAERERCLQDAGTSEARIRDCNDRGFYFGYEIHLDGIDVRYKYYAYRWHYAYAVQMHHKYLLIDGDELWTGSYNLSDNAEHNTMENIVLFTGPRFAALIDRYEENFEALWRTERETNRLQDLLQEVRTDRDIPLVFAPMALTWEEITLLKEEIRSNCALIDTAPYRSSPEGHRTCPR